MPRGDSLLTVSPVKSACGPTVSTQTCYKSTAVCVCVCVAEVSCASTGCHFKTNFPTRRGQGHAVWLRTGPQTLWRAFLISVIPAEDYNANPWDKSLLVTERPSAVAVNQRRLLNYSFSVYSRRQVRDLCDESPGRLGEVVTREKGLGEALGGGEVEVEEEGGSTQRKLPICHTQEHGKVSGCFCFSCFLILRQTFRSGCMGGFFEGRVEDAVAKFSFFGWAGGSK